MANEIRDAFDAVYPDGPASAPDQPMKSAVRGIVGQTIQSQFDILKGLVFEADQIFANTAAGLAATTEGYDFKVESDDTDVIAYYAYRKTGGAAVLIAEVPAASALATKVDLADLEDVQIFGVDTVATGDTDQVNRILVEDRAALADGYVRKIKASWGRANTGQIVAGSLDKNAKTFTPRAIVGSFTSVVGTLDEVDVTSVAKVLKGEYLGIWQWSIRVSAASPPPKTLYTSTVSATTTTPTPGVAIPVPTVETEKSYEVSFGLEYIGPNPARIEDIEEAAGMATQDLATVKPAVDRLFSEVIIGNPDPQVEAQKTISRTYVYSAGTAGKAVKAIKIAGSDTPGPVRFYAATLNTDTLAVTVDEGSEVVVTTESETLETYVLPEQLVLGGYFAVRPKNRVATKAGNGLPFWNDPTSDTNASFTAVYNDGNELQMQLICDEQAVTSSRLIGAEENIAGLQSGLGVTGQTRTITISNSESAIYGVDSTSCGLYSVPSKAFPCHIGNLTDFRIINASQTGRDALGFADDVRNGTLFTTFGVSITDITARYLLMASAANDAYMYNADVEYFQENYFRAAAMIRAAGIEPVFVSQIDEEKGYRLAKQAAALKADCAYFDAGAVYRRDGGLPAWQIDGHHTTCRSNALYHQPISAWVNEHLGQPVQGIKIFRPQPSFSISSADDLLFDTIEERYEKWKEINIAHRPIVDDYIDAWDALDEGLPLETWVSGVDVPDEYQALKEGASIDGEDYLLIEAIVPAAHFQINKLSAKLNVPAGATVYVRYWDYDDGIPGKTSENTVTAQYLSVWNTPKGAWEAISAIDGVDYVFPETKGYMQGRKVQLLVAKAGSFTMAAPSFTVSGQLMEFPSTPLKPLAAPAMKRSATQLVAAPTFDASLTGWTAAGAPVADAPVDAPYLPWTPGNIGARCTHVAKITDTDTVTQSVSIAATAVDRVFELSVWHRFNPPAYVDPTGRGWDADQYIDRTISTYPDDSPINSDTFDFRWFELIVAMGSTIPANGGAVIRCLSPTAWRETRFDIDVPAGEVGDFTFRLQSTGATLEVAFVECREIIG
ncbi:hypothetical protein [Martelella endophytica]|uniref:Uncharacterized protein n=1 Tax=Martelella endophytica TaxID=1486262 RepID=A0A0D5LKD4_MAREN|nr:hypothetical protein [Martelella endophytica]AJY44659.1 hypothetical protein TM49_01515 [Martelella endophytica]